MNDIVETRIWRISGFLALLLELSLFAASTVLFVDAVPVMDAAKVATASFYVAMAILLLACVCMGGFFIVQPNEAKVLTFFGRYIGSVRKSGFHWTNPLTKKAVLSLRVRNFATDTLKVNDALGNPIEIGAIVVWRVIDTAKALYSVQNYADFVTVQSETALRVLASRFPYDSADHSVESLRGSQDEVSKDLRVQLQERLASAGVEVDDARLSHLAYSPEIAQAMLRRQQAGAIIAARRLIVDGAVGMVKMALEDLEAQGVVKLDNERRASMVNNLLVALVSESQAQPVINTGTLYA
jgi:regulator of protease activity HflC (stomatin/prohibitin superfamily)